MTSLALLWRSFNSLNIDAIFLKFQKHEYSVEGVITFDSIREAYRKEKSSRKLQKLDDSFFKSVKKYLNEKISDINKARERSNRFSDKLIKSHETEFTNAFKTLQDLYDLRETKIINLAAVHSRAEGVSGVDMMSSKERKTFHELVKLLKSLREETLKLEEAETAQFLKVKLLEDLPEVAGVGGVYGPYETGTITELPEKIANILVNNDKAVIVK